jgi:predicted RNA polymerase sigma factor
VSPSPADETPGQNSSAHVDAGTPAPTLLDEGCRTRHPPDDEETDWAQIVGLYDLLERVGPNPMVTLNHAVAVAMTRGPQAGLDLLRGLETDGRKVGHHRVDAVRAHLLEMAGDVDAARASYRSAARRTTSLPEQRYLEARAARLGEKG